MPLPLLAPSAFRLGERWSAPPAHRPALPACPLAARLALSRPLPCCACCSAWADRHGYDPFVLELDLKPFGVHQPKITLQASSLVRAGGRVKFMAMLASLPWFAAHSACPPAYSAPAHRPTLPHAPAEPHRQRCGLPQPHTLRQDVLAQRQRRGQVRPGRVGMASAGIGQAACRCLRRLFMPVAMGPGHGLHLTHPLTKPSPPPMLPLCSAAR